MMQNNLNMSYMKNVFSMLLASACIANVAMACGETNEVKKEYKREALVQEITPSSGVACSPYEYTSTKEITQLLGSLRDGTDVDSEINMLQAQKPKVHKVVKKRPKPVEVKHEEVMQESLPEVHTATPEVAKHPTPTVEIQLMEHPVAPAPKVETKPEPQNHSAAESLQRLTRLEFSKGMTELDSAHKLSLSSVGIDMKANQSLSIKVNSYAFAQGSELSEARRIALQRAIKVRKTLIEQDIAPTRISVSTFEQEGAGTDYIELNTTSTK